jgi:hypothetical protein
VIIRSFFLDPTFIWYLRATYWRARLDPFVRGLSDGDSNRHDNYPDTRGSCITAAPSSLSATSQMARRSLAERVLRPHSPTQHPG